jgi:ABC-2 type transport system ATP-binding protein
VVLGGERALYWRLTGRENLWYFSQLYNMPEREANPRIQELLGLVGLADRADERVETYSKGMKQRLHIARGLLNDPEILLLDEPTIGLDPHAARSLRGLVRDLVDRRGTTVVLTTHYMYEADQLSDRVAILSKGRIVACDSPSALKAQHAGSAAFRLEARGEDDLRGVLSKLPGVAEVVGRTRDEGRGVEIYRVIAQRGAEETLPGALAAAVAERKAQLVGLTREEPSLEDVFVKLTGEAIGDRGEAEAA